MFDSNMRATAVARLQMETEFRRAVERNEFENYYQTIVSLRTGKVCGFETLVRWNSPTRGLVHPSEFIGIAEETGLIVPLGQRILETACQQTRIWQSKFSGDVPLTINVNLSSRHFLQSDLLNQCRTILYRTNLARNSLYLEVTENTMIPNPEAAIELMYQLKKLGIKIALDDFGTGYSSLSYLHRFPLDSLKIDRSFVARVMEDDELVRTILTMGRNLGLKVVAEGVETLEQANKLRSMGCEYVQGYYFSVPVTAEEAIDLIWRPNLHSIMDTEMASFQPGYLT